MVGTVQKSPQKAAASPPKAPASPVKPAPSSPAKVAPSSPSKPAPSPPKPVEKRKAEEHSESNSSKKFKDEPGYTAFFHERYVEIRAKHVDDDTIHRLISGEWEKLSAKQKAEFAAKDVDDDEEEEEDDEEEDVEDHGGDDDEEEEDDDE